MEKGGNPRGIEGCMHNSLFKSNGKEIRKYAAHIRALAGKIHTRVLLNRLNVHLMARHSNFTTWPGMELFQNTMWVQEGYRNNRHDLYSQATPGEMPISAI